MDKIFIKNRKGQKLAVIVEQPEGEAMGLAFVMHGLGGFKEQPHIRTKAEAFFENGYTTVTFDTTNSIGESDGKYEDATITNNFKDLEDVIDWSKSQKWYQEPFCLAGHSLGGISTGLYAEIYPQRVKSLVPFGTVVSGKLSAETLEHRKDRKDWQRTGWLVSESASKPGVIKRLPWSHMKNRMQYDLLPKVDKLTMPVLLVVGSEDEGTPPEHQKILFDSLPGRKEMYVVEKAPHTFREPEHLAELKQILDRWIKNLK